MSTWDEIDRGLSDLADTLGVRQSPREAQFNAALDELARGPFPEIPSEIEALEAYES